MKPPSIPPWLPVAQTYIGTKEEPGPADNARITEMYALAGHSEVTADSVPWCAAFACAVLEQSGTPSPQSLRARDFLQWGEPVTSPRAGDIAVLRRGKDESSGHVTFFVRWNETGTKFLGLGGNQSDEVRYSWFAESDVLPGGFRRPTPTPTEQAAPRQTTVKASRKWSLSEAWSRILGVFGIGAGGTAVADQADMLPGAILLVKQYATDHASLLIVGGVVAGVLVSETVKHLVAEDTHEGRYMPSGEQ